MSLCYGQGRILREGHFDGSYITDVLEGTLLTEPPFCHKLCHGRVMLTDIML